MKRFYKDAVAMPAAEIAAVAADDGFAVLLDGKPIRTQTRAHLVVPSQALAEAVAGEWAEQGDEIDPQSMAMMAFASTAIDRVLPQRDAVAADAARYGANDLLCYRSDRQEALKEREAAGWQPLLDWAEATYGARLKVTEGVLPVAQDNAALMLLGRAVGAFDAFPLTALHVMTTTTGSLILALAVAEGRLTPDEAHALATLDETYQAEQWGDDPEAAERRAAIGTEIADAARFLDLL